ncbi:SDR family oxidoreductase [Terriglobus saanensis]|uniref:NAD-dependent epimerase/dehydratase n=1 Tax=Terriglobus saanensis (strain ATCC BAA-1853 / DSM 23119 / SP1PR4) TaxID=401053 RepID=E8UX35_TERSS|nr:SDR family oxidoreductase [Terriglobus saanensis]ADV81922.1 NAD-dependent epimerase/dehydratase [Terriglobus saanensis SP1PR4]
MSTKQVVLVAGAQGVIGYAAATYIGSLPDTQVYGLSRRSMEAAENFMPLNVDMLSEADTERALAPLKDVTHVVFGAYVEKNTPAERSAVNVTLLRNLLNTVEKHSPGLEHVTLYQGGKAYGADLGPFKTPAREDDPRLMSPNFYYDQEDFLKAQQDGKNWHYTVLRPEAVCGYGIGNPMNLTMVIGVYAAISKELGLPLRFPGPEAAYRALYQVTSADILARASSWAGTTESAREQIFNITNGDYFRWQFMWPRIAKSFHMEVAEPVPMPLSIYMADKGPLWADMTKRYGLKPIPYEQIVSWPFGDFIFNSAFDNITSTIKARQHGFQDCIDTEDMFSDFFSNLRSRHILPPL